MHSIALSKHFWEIKNKYDVEPIEKLRVCNYKANDKFCLILLLANATYANSQELRNQQICLFHSYWKWDPGLNSLASIATKMSIPVHNM